MTDDPAVVGPDGEQLEVFTDGEIVVTFTDGSEAVESFEGAGQEMELEFERAQPVEKITFRQTSAVITRG
jgi:hypothetical protein